MNRQNSIRILLCGIAAAILCHLLVVAGMIPAEYAWGGQIHERKELYAMETVSIGILLFFGWLLMMKGGYIQRKINDKIIHVLLWLFFILFLLNTIGNLFAKTAFEKSLSLLTLFFAALLLRILIPPQNKKD